MKRLLARRLGRLVIPVTIGIAAAGSTAETIHVECTATPPGDGSPESPFKTIQEGIIAAVDSDTVLVHDCQYDYFGPGNRDIDFFGKAITVKSENGPDNCTIVCGTPQQQPHRAFLFHRGEGRDSVVSGFTIRGGRGGDDGIGGAIWCQDSSPTITNNRITGNDGTHGGAIYCEDSAPMIRGNEITGNTASSHGGGIYFDGGDVEILNNTINANTAGGYGGAVKGGSSSPLIMHNEIRGNSARHGGGLSCNGCTATVAGNTISENTAIEHGGGIQCDGGTASLTENEISDNSGQLGGGLYFYDCSTTISCNTINDNHASNDGGGIANIWYASTASINNNLIIGNTAADFGGGLFGDPSSATIVNNRIIGNAALWAGGIGLWQTNSSWSIRNNTIAANRAFHGDGAGIYCDNRCPTIINTILWGNDSDDLYHCCSDQGYTTYSCIQDGDPGVGNIFYDPLFVAPGYWDDSGTPPDLTDDFWVHGDYHLQPGSPSIDTADPYFLPEDDETDMDGGTRLCDGDSDGWPTVDMGADEFVSSRADGDCNGQVDLLDFRSFAGCMTGPGGGTPCQCGVFELDGDNDIDLDDLAVLQSAFTRP